MLFKEFGEFLLAVKESGLGVGEILGLIGGVLLEVAAAVGLVVFALKFLDWQGILGAAVVLGGIAIVIKTLTGLIDALTKSNLKISDVLTDLGIILAGIIILMAAITLAAKLLGNDPLALLGVLAVTAAISAILLVLKDTLPTILDALAKFINSIAPSVIELTRTIGDIIDRIIYALGDVLPPIIERIGQVFEIVFEGIRNVVSTVGEIIRDVLSGIKDIIQQIGDTVSQILEGIGNLIEKVADIILNFVREIGPAIENSVNAIIRAVTNLINFVISGIEYMVNRVIDGVNGMSGLLSGLPFVDIPQASYIYIPRFSGYANGGFPEDGFFYANHNELIGEFANGRTAVANNEQIIKGIQEGVFSAMMSALQNSDMGGNVTIEATGDTEGLLNFISFKQRQKNRQFN